MTLLIISHFVLAAALISLGVYLYQLNKSYKKLNEKYNSLLNKQQQVIEINQKNKEYNWQLEQDKNKLEKLIADKNLEFQVLNEKFLTTQENFYEQAKQQAESQYRQYKLALDQNYEQQKIIIQQDLFALKEKADVDFNIYQTTMHDKKIKLETEIQNIETELSNLKSKQDTYIAEQQRQEEIAKQQDYYKLILAADDMDDIAELRKIQKIIQKKEVVDKIIWSAYYKPAFDVLMAHICPNTNHCGIYKITCLSTGKAYIGQSANIKTRFSDHIKSGLSYTSTNNKLYQEMKQYSPTDFIFEILEEVPRESLNEREKYWINFYQTNLYGLNTQKGNNT